MKAADVPEDGVMYQVATDPRDGHGTEHDDRTVVGKHGETLNGIVLHVPGVTDRAVLEQHLLTQVESLARPGIALCGITHVEDIGIWQTPHTMRDAFRREIARLGRDHKRPVLIVHGWQHVGPCPDGHPT